MKFEFPYASLLWGTNCWILLFIPLKLCKFKDSVQVRFATPYKEWYNLFYLSEAPLVNLSLGGRYYNEGSPVIIACEASGKPLPDVAWIRNGVLKSSAKKAAFLKFDNINRTDAGRYTCRANNSVEVTSIDTTIVVYCKYILTIIFFSEFSLFTKWLLLLGLVTQNWRIFSKVQRNRIPPQMLFSFVCIGSKYWLDNWI